MNAVQRDLAGWDSEKLSERSAVLRLNATTDVTFSVRQKRLFMASIHSCEFVVEGPVTRPAQGNIRAHQSGWLKRQPVTFRRQNRPPTRPLPQPFSAFTADIKRTGLPPLSP
jgi:hypothetical protein